MRKIVGWIGCIVIVFILVSIIASQYIETTQGQYQDQRAGVLFEVERSIIGQETGMVFARLYKEDGTTFEEGLEAYEFEMFKEEVVRGSSRMQRGLSPDKKSIQVIIDMKSEELLKGKRLTLTAMEQGDINHGKWILVIPLVKNHSREKFKFNPPFENKKHDMMITEIELDALEIKIKGYQEKRGEKLALLDSGTLKLQMKDGEKINLRASEVDSLFEKQFVYWFVPEEEVLKGDLTMSRVLEADQIEALIIGEEVVKIR